MYLLSTSREVLKGILVKVCGLTIPVDFVVLDVYDLLNKSKEHNVLFGRPFMVTNNVLIDFKEGTCKIYALNKIICLSMLRGKINSLFSAL